MTDLSHLEILDPMGSPVRIGGLIDRPTIINLVRYYGCAPCRSHLGRLADRHDEIIAAGGAVLGIGVAAAHQALHLIEAGGIPFPLLLDPEHRVAEAIDLGRQPLVRFLFHPKGWWRWLKSLRRARQGTLTGNWAEVPGIVVVDGSARVVWAYRGRFMGDYPPMEETMARLRSAIAEPS